MAQLMRREKSTNPAMGEFVGWPADAEKAKKRRGIIKSIMEGTYNPLDWGEREKQTP